jgi:thermitase
LAGLFAAGCTLSPSAPAPKKGFALGNRSVQETLASRYVGANAPSALAEVIVTSRNGAPVQLPGTQTVSTMVVGGRSVSLARVLPGTSAKAFVEANKGNAQVEVAENDLWWAQAAATPGVAGTPPVSSLPGDEFQSVQYGLTRMNVAEAWKVTLGNPDLIVAVLDTGVDYNHPEFAGRIVKGPNFSYRKPEPTSGGAASDVSAGNSAAAPGKAPQSGLPVLGPDDPMDDFGHGTHVAGIIAAAADGKGVVGVAPRVKIMAIKVLGAAGGGTTWDIAQGIHYAYKNGAKIINLSLGGPKSNDFVDLLISDARAHGSLVVAASGNNGWNLDGPPVSLGGLGSIPHSIYPAMYKGAMAVGATDDADKLAAFSNYGRKLSVVAPGVKIVSTMPTGPCAMTKQAGFMNHYDAMSGTSMATPMAAGAAALTMSAHPDWTPDQVQEALERTADSVGPAPFFGKGRVNVGKAVI